MRDRAPGILSGLALLASLSPAQTPPKPAPRPESPQTQTARGASDFPDSYTYARRYKAGELNSYEVCVRDPELAGEMIGVSEHRVFLRKGVPVERVRWIRLSESDLGDLSAMALDLPAYEMSLHPEGELTLL